MPPCGRGARSQAKGHRVLTASAAAGTARLNRTYPWVVLGISFTTVAAAFGCRGAFALFFVAVVEEFQWSRGLTAGALTLGAAAWTVSAPVWGRMLDRFGPRLVFPAGAGLMAAGFVVSGMTETVWQYYLGMGLLVGLGFAALPMTSQAIVISNWFVRKRGMAMGVAASGVGAGIFLVVPAAERLIVGLGWRNAYLVLAGVMLAAVVPLNLFFQRRRPQDMGLLPDLGATAVAGPKGAGAARTGGWTLGRALRSSRFWVLALGFLLGAVPVHMVLVHQVAAMVDAGFSRELGAAVLSLTGLFTTFSMIGMGMLSDRTGREWAYTIGSMALTGGILLILFLDNVSEVFLVGLYPPLFAVGFSSRQSLYPTIAADIFHGPHFGSIIGAAALFIGAGSGVGPWLAGYLHDLSGDYASACWTAIALGLLSLACIWAAAPRKGVDP